MHNQCSRQLVLDVWEKWLFSVWSAYRMLVDTKLRREAWIDSTVGSSSTDRDTVSWKLLWKTQVPGKNLHVPMEVSKALNPIWRCENGKKYGFIECMFFVWRERLLASVHVGVLHVEMCLGIARQRIRETLVLNHWAERKEVDICYGQHSLTYYFCQADSNDVGNMMG